MLALMAMTQVAGVVVQPVMLVQAESMEAKFPFTAATQNRLKQAQSSYEKANGSKSTANIKKAIEDFSNILDDGNTEDNKAVQYNTSIQKLFDNLRNLVYGVDAGQRDYLANYFLGQMSLAYTNEGETKYDIFMEQLVEKNEIASLADSFTNMASNVNFFKSYFEMKEDMKGKLNDKGQFYIENKLEFDVPVGEAVVPETPENFNEEVEVNHEEATGLAEGTTWEDVYYEVVDGNRVKVTTTYTIKDGKVVSDIKRDVEGQSPFLIADEELTKIFTSGEQVEVIDQRKSDAMDNEEVESNLTLQYTVTKGQEDAYYYDTGIRVDKDGTATYQQMHDTLYQLAIRAEGYLVEDKDKFLIVVEGKPVHVTESKKAYTKEEVEDLFKAFDEVEVRIMETRIGTTASLEEQIVTGQAQQVSLDGKVLDLKTKPAIKDGRIVLPIKEIAEFVGAESTIEGSKLTVKQNGHTIVFEDKVKSVLVDGSIIEMSSPAELNEKSVLLGDVSEMLKALEIEKAWDEETSTLVLTRLNAEAIVDETPVESKTETKETDKKEE